MESNHLINQVNNQIMNGVDKLKDEILKIKEIVENEDEKELTRIELVFDKIYANVSESDLEILDDLDKLKRSGMYIKINYDNLYNLSKDTPLEEDIRSLEKFMRNPYEISLDELLDLKGNIFDGEVAHIIIQRIGLLKQKRKRDKYVRLLHAKILYMISVDEIEDEEKEYLSSLLLQNYYSDLDPKR